MEFILSNRGERKCLYQGYAYIKDKISQNATGITKHWKCDQKSLKCPGRLISVNSEIQYMKEHSHPSDPTRIDSLKAKHILKEEAKVSNEDTSSLITKCFYKKIPSSSIGVLPKRSSLARMVRRLRSAPKSDIINIKKENVQCNALHTYQNVSTSSPYYNAKEESSINEIPTPGEVICEKTTLGHICPLNAFDTINMKFKSTKILPYKLQKNISILYYSPGNEDDWKADGYRWRCFQSHSNPKSNPIILKKIYRYLVKKDNGLVLTPTFQRIVYNLLDDPEGKEGTLIQYIGTVPIEETPTLLEDTASNNQTRDNEMPSDTLDKSQTESQNQDSVPCLNESNLASQTETVSIKTEDLSEEREIAKLKDCEHSSLLDLIEDYGDFVPRFSCIPDTTLVLAHKAMLLDFNIVLGSNSHLPQLLSYQTSEKIGDFYVSSLLFRHILFREAPVIPVAFLIHQNDKQFTHEVFFNYIANEVAEINGKVILTNKEDNIIKALKNQLPHVKNVQPWDYFHMRVNSWLAINKPAKGKSCPYWKDLKQLLRSLSENEYKKRLDDYTKTWSLTFLEFYKQELQSEVTSWAGRWILGPLGVYDSNNGVNPDHCNYLQKLLGDLKTKIELSVDSLVVGLHILQNYYINELQHSHAGLGNYHLLESFKCMLIPANQITIQNSFEPHGIVEKMIEWRNKLSESAGPSQSEDQIKIAKIIIENKNCVYHPNLKRFVVNEALAVNEVSLFSQESCTCPAKKDCVHVLAAKLYMGFDVADLGISKIRKFYEQLKMTGVKQKRNYKNLLNYN